MTNLAQSRGIQRLQDIRTQRRVRAVALARAALREAEQSILQAQQRLEEACRQEQSSLEVLRAAQRGSGGGSPLHILSLIGFLEQSQHRHQAAIHHVSQAQGDVNAALERLNASQVDWRIQQERASRWSDRCETLLKEATAQRDDADEEALEEDLGARHNRVEVR